MKEKHTSVSYYGMNSVEQAARDFADIRAHGCDTVVLAVTEFDMDFYFPNVRAIVEAARKAGLRVLADLWGIGKYFGGEQVSLFLQNNVKNRQVSALTDEPLAAVCFNTNSFRDYMRRLAVKLALETETDGFFWDEPHYALPKSYASITGGAGDDWSCRCPVCRERFAKYYGYEMPKNLTDDVKRFRWREAMDTISSVSAELKRLRPDAEITMCVHATLGSYYVTELRGYDLWDEVAACPYFDVFSTTIINWELPDRFFREVTERTAAAANKYGKQSERWLMGYYKQPEDFGQIERWTDICVEAGVDRLAAWTFRGGAGTVLAAPEPIRLWDGIGQAFVRFRTKGAGRA